MACLFGLSTRANTVRRRYNASFSYVLNDDRKHNSTDEGPPLEGMGNLSQQKPFGSSSNRFINNNDSAVFGFFHNRRCQISLLRQASGCLFVDTCQQRLVEGQKKLSSQMMLLMLSQTRLLS
ncbi:hypothetical protein Peur_020057 [Populus x canadensis]